MSLLETLSLSSRGTMPVLAGANEWLNSTALTRVDLEGHVVAVDFWTFTCVNWIRTAPFRRAWDETYRDHGLTLIGVHTPEFPFERDPASIRAAVEERGITYPVAVDSDFAIWNTFANRYWPALYVADRTGAIRFTHFGEGAYSESERVIRELLGLPPTSRSAVIDAVGVEAQADWEALESPETYLGTQRAVRFASTSAGTSERGYTTPASLRLNEWALAGDWTIGPRAATLHTAGGRLVYRFHARDVNLVMGPSPASSPARFRVRVDGRAPGASRGVDVDEHGAGIAADRRLYQLVRQSGNVDEHTFEITFLEPGVEAYVFTFG
jgi:hypothetical protein